MIVITSLCFRILQNNDKNEITRPKYNVSSYVETLVHWITSEEELEDGTSPELDVEGRHRPGCVLKICPSSNSEKMN